MLARVTPTLTESARFSEQATALNLFSANHGLDNPVLIGHSNGGLVSREGSRTQLYAGIITVGTLHHGAEITNNLDDIFGIGSNLTYAFQDILFTEILEGGQSTLWFFCQALAYFGISLVNPVLSNAYYRLAEKPVLEDMKPASTFLGNLNDPANLAREAGSLTRVGIYVQADADFVGGPFRLVYEPNVATSLMQSTITIGWALEAEAFNRFNGIDWTSWQSIIELSAVYSAYYMGSIFTALPGIWCGEIGAYEGATCGPSDALVPVPSQVYPGTDVFSFTVSGPSHTEETHDEGVYSTIKFALISRFNVPVR
jgi:hypothetical protein